tara:strand:+ start:192 stop:755 length:564 start_codon:yes stop_codon:yes gene_type:complete
MEKNESSVVEQNNDTQSADKQNVANQTAVEGNDSPNSVPYARFNEIVKQNKKLNDKLDKLSKQQEADRMKEMEEQNKFQELYTELKAQNQKLTEKNEYYGKLEQEERDGLLAQLSEEEQEIYSDLPTTKLRTHIANMSSKNAVASDKSAAIRGNNLKIKHDSDIWKMNSQDRKSSWGDVLNHFKNKK